MPEDTSTLDPETTTTGTVDSANQGVTQTGEADAGAGTADAATSSGADQASTTTDTSSAVDHEQRFNDALNQKHAQTQQATTPSAQAQAQALTLEAVNKALGITSPDDLKRVVNERSLLGRQANELGQLRQQYAQAQQQMAQAQAQREQEAQRANLSPFHAKHPQFQVNQGRIAKANAFNSALDALPPEVRANQQVVQQMAARMGVSREDLNLANDAKSYQERILAEQASDPEGFVEARAMRVVQDQLSRFEQYLNNRFQTQAFVQQHQALINDPKAQQVMSEVLDERTSRADLAVRIANLERERAELLSKAKSETAEVETLKAQNDLASRQVITRRRASTSTTTQSDPWESYKENPNDPKAHDNLLKKLYGA